VREELKDVVVYRIQIKSRPKQLDLKQIVVNGKHILLMVITTSRNIVIQ